MGMSGRPMDLDEWGTVGINVEILISDAPCQYIAGYSIGSPEGSTQSILSSDVSEDLDRG